MTILVLWAAVKLYGICSRAMAKRNDDYADDNGNSADNPITTEKDFAAAEGAGGTELTAGAELTESEKMMAAMESNFHGFQVKDENMTFEFEKLGSFRFEPCASIFASDQQPLVRQFVPKDT